MIQGNSFSPPFYAAPNDIPRSYSPGFPLINSSKSHYVYRQTQEQSIGSASGQQELCVRSNM